MGVVYQLFITCHVKMEVRLLKDRFPSDSLLEDCGEFLNEFFCARIVDGQSHEGRLFLTQKAFFFVSTFSVAISYDTSFGIDEIVEVKALQRIIPSVRLLLKQKDEEEFTNFHDLNKIITALRASLPEGTPIDIKKQALYPKYNRLVSVPMKSHPSFGDHAHHPLKSKKGPAPCPYFSKSGFCPRKPFCRLSHDLTPVSPPDVPQTSKSDSLDELPGKFATTKLVEPEFLRSISSPACTTVPPEDQPPSKEETNHKVTSGDDTAQDGRTSTPEPVSKLNKPYIDQLINKIDVPQVPTSFVFGQEPHEVQTLDSSFISETHLKRKKGTGDIFENESTSPTSCDDIQITSPGHKPTQEDGQAPPPYTDGSRKVCFYEDYNSEEDEFEQEIPPMIMPSSLLVYPAGIIGREDINSGDKVILSVDILMACEQRQLTYPMAFSFSNKSANKMVHCGVLEFTSPEPNAAFLPQWMFDHLSITQGQEVNFQHVDLPKGTFVQLQPVSSAWLGVPYDKRMSIMEFQLRNFQTLTEDTKVTITYELNRYTFKVLKCKPSKGISIVDADLTTDVVEPADFNRFHSVEEWQAENIPLDESIQCSLLAGQYRHFVLLSLPGQQLPPYIVVEVKQESGDPDLFLCQTCSTPSQSRYTWCSQDMGDVSISLNASTDTHYNTERSLFAGVVSLCEDTVFTICFHSQNQHGSESASSNSHSVTFHTSLDTQGHVLRSATGSSSGGTVDGIIEDNQTNVGEEQAPPIPPGHEQCSYCGSIMPQLRLLMHERHCAQSTFKCSVCKQCFPKSAEKKHHLIAHELLTCECGRKLSQVPLHSHQLMECNKRSVMCPFKWCQLSFPLDQLENHENTCGRKQVSCPVCSEDVSQLELEMHLEAFHLVEVDKIDWTKPLSSQVLSFRPSEPKFKCHCGTGFEFEDDLQVHQLTECFPQTVENEDVVG